ncbi:hypothetical protein [Vallitalea okinawensis]|uniref:hypothetical protein n=1 Tax=Vallitalea okinawensis TaxID=2078660 RepID=UPI000CFB2155|nr:hypothetical protein [Vallitalea okinawensis]
MLTQSSNIRKQKFFYDVSILFILFILTTLTICSPHLSYSLQKIIIESDPIFVYNSDFIGPLKMILFFFAFMILLVALFESFLEKYFIELYKYILKNLPYNIDLDNKKLIALAIFFLILYIILSFNYIYVNDEGVGERIFFNEQFSTWNEIKEINIETKVVGEKKDLLFRYKILLNNSNKELEFTNIISSQKKEELMAVHEIAIKNQVTIKKDEFTIDKIRALDGKTKGYQEFLLYFYAGFD